MINLFNGKKVNRFFPVFYYLILLIALSFILFFQVTKFEMVQDDELVYFNNDTDYYEADLQDFSSIWQIPEKSMYIPVTYTIWYLGSLLSHNSNNYAAIFHAINLIIHILNGLLVFLILKKLITSDMIAFCGAFIFLVHPIQVEAWAYISGLRGLLSTFFGFTIVLIHLTKQRNLKWLVINLLLFALALLSKPTIVFLPLLLIMLDIYQGTSKFYSAVLRSIPYFLISIFPIMLLLRPADSLLYQVPISPFWAKPLFWMDSTNFYIFKIFWPWKLAASYARTPDFLVSQWWFYVGWIVPLIISLWVILKSKKVGLFFVSWLWIIISILPVSGIISFVYQNWSNVADRYTYFSFLGISLALSYWLKLSKLKKINYITAGLILIFGIYSATVQLPVWENDYTLWKHCTEVTPGESKAFYNLANEQSKRGELLPAFDSFSNALQLDSNFVDSWLGRGIINRKLKQYTHALKDFNQAAVLAPQKASIFLNRALAYIYVNIDIRALQDLSRAIVLKPDYVEAYVNRGNLYAKSGKLDDAQNDYLKAIDLDHTHAEAYNNLGNISAKQRKINEAIEYFSRALNIDSNYKDARNNRALANYFQENYLLAKKDLEYMIARNEQINQKLYKEILGKVEKR